MTGYIEEMRKLVGHSTIMQCAASVIVENPVGETLLQLRTDNHCWGYAGGAIEIDEVVEDAAKRELFEETGLTANKLELLGIFSGPDTHHIYPNGDEVSNIEIVYICRDYSGELQRQESEVEELRFFPLNGLPTNISPPIVKALKAYVDSRVLKQFGTEERISRTKTVTILDAVKK